MAKKEIIPGLDPDEEEFGLGDPEADETFEDDFTDSDATRPLIAEGRHPAICIGFERGPSKKGNMQYTFDFKVTAGPSAGMTRKYYTPLTPTMRWRGVAALEALGVKSARTAVKFKKSDILGKPCVISVVHGTYLGNPDASIADVFPPDEEAIEAAAEVPTV